jgi:LysM repeat protein
MKRLGFLLVTLALCAPTALPAQDAATQERLAQINGTLDDLAKAQEVLRKRVDELKREVESLHEQSAKPSPSYAKPEDLKSLAEAIKTVDRKRMEDADTTQAELIKLRKLLEAPVSGPKKPPTSKPPKETTSSATPPVSATGFEHVVKSGDTLDAIVQAYRVKNVKVSVSQVVAANPGLKPERLKVGQKIFIPAPTQ